MSEPTKIPYWRMWLLSQSLIYFGLFIFLTNHFGTFEYFEVAAIMGIFTSIPTGLFAVGVGTIIFFAIKNTIKRRRPTFRVAIAWLLSPTLIFLLLLLVAGLVQNLPKNRLTFVTRGFDLRSARDIQVSGYTAFLRGLWMAKLKTGSTEFQEFAATAGLELTDSNSLHRVTKQIPASFQVNLQTGLCYKRSYLDDDKRERASLSAHFDPETGVALVVREFHD